MLSSGAVLVLNGGWLRQRRSCIRASGINTCTAAGWLSNIGNFSLCIKQASCHGAPPKCILTWPGWYQGFGSLLCKMVLYTDQLLMQHNIQYSIVQYSTVLYSIVLMYNMFSACQAQRFGIAFAVRHGIA